MAASGSARWRHSAWNFAAPYQSCGFSPLIANIAFEASVTGCFEVGTVCSAAAQVDVSALRMVLQVLQGKVVIQFGDGEYVLAHLYGPSGISNANKVDDRIELATGIETGVVEHGKSLALGNGPQFGIERARCAHEQVAFIGSMFSDAGYQVFGDMTACP